MPQAQAYGLDYSARELSPQEIDDYNRANPNARISFLIRYIGYRTNKKCISHYPGALRAHEQSGRRVLLVHQVAYNDFLGGEQAGIAHARLSVADAEREGWQHDTPMFAAYDRFLAGNPAKGITPMSLNQVRDYVGGFRSVLGDLAGLYGFFDVMGPCVAENWVPWRWQCGAESALVRDVQFYQWNNGRAYVNGLECDLNKAFIDLTSIGGNMALTGPDGNVEWAVEDPYDRAAAEAEGRAVRVEKQKVADWVGLGALHGVYNAVKLDQVLANQARSEAREVATLTAVTAIAQNPSITLDAMRELVNDAVSQHVQITGTVQIQSRPAPLMIEGAPVPLVIEGSAVDADAAPPTGG